MPRLRIIPISDVNPAVYSRPFNPEATLTDASWRPAAPPGPALTDASWRPAAPLGIPTNAWTLGGAGLALAAIIAVGAVGAILISRRSAVPNTLETDWMAKYLPRSPEAALMIMPPAIPSYLAYKYALKRMRPGDEEVTEQWRDFAPEGAYNDGDLY